MQEADPRTLIVSLGTMFGRIAKPFGNIFDEAQDLRRHRASARLVASHRKNVESIEYPKSCQAIPASRAMMSVSAAGYLMREFPGLVDDDRRRRCPNGAASFDHIVGPTDAETLDDMGL